MSQPRQPYQLNKVCDIQFNWKMNILATSIEPKVGISTHIFVPFAINFQQKWEENVVAIFCRSIAWKTLGSVSIRMKMYCYQSLKKKQIVWTYYVDLEYFKIAPFLFPHKMWFRMMINRQKNVQNRIIV